MFGFGFGKAAKKTTGKVRERSAAAIAAACRSSVESLEERRMFSFSGTAVLPTGVSVTAMATADFNGDGLMDIVTVGSASGRGLATVQLNNGDGTYGAPHSSITANSPVDVEVGDFDGDGHCDIVTLASYYTGALTVLKGNGDGTFQAPISYTVATPPTSLKVADVNNDGHPDLVAGNHYFNSVSVFLNDGLGNFGAKVNYTGGGSPASVGVADFNNDGKVDLLSTNQNTSGSITINYGNGDGTFGAPVTTPTTTAPLANVVGDFNGDGNADIAMANSFGSSTVTVLYGKGDGTFQAPALMVIPGQPLDIQKGDFNHDGKIDLAERTGSGIAIELNNGDGTFANATIVPLVSGNSLSVADFNGDGFSDAAISNAAGSVSIYTNDLGTITNPQNVATLTMTAPATALSGAPIPITVTAVDDSGNVITNYGGTVSIFTTDPFAPVVNYTFTAADAGVHTFSSEVSMVSTGPQSIIVTAPLAASTSATVQVLAAPATRFSLALPDSDVTAGTPVSITVTALDASNNMGATYVGTVHFTSSDLLAGLPADYTFTTADAGVHTFSVILRTAGAQTVSVADTLSASVKGTSNPMLVEAGEVSNLILTGGSGSIGRFRAVKIDSADKFGNFTGPARTIHFTSSDPLAVLPADVTLVNGDATVMVKFMTVGAQTLTATDITNSTVSGTEAITATAADIGSFVVTGFPSTTAGVTQKFTVSAIDAVGKPMPNYTGTVTFSSSDWQAGLPASYTFTAADKGVHQFTATLKTAGPQSIRVSESLFGSVGSQTGINVSAGTVTNISSTGVQHTVAGVSFPMVITARDAFGNLATNYIGKVKFTSTDAKAVLPAQYQFTAADAGVHSFPIVLKTATAKLTPLSVTAVDVSNPAVTTTVAGIEVANAAAANFTLAVPSNITAGTAFTAKLSVTDAFGNEVKDYTGTVHFSNTAGVAGLPLDYTFNSLDAGVHTFTFTLSSTTSQTLSANDTSNSLLVTSALVTPKAAGTTTTGGGGGGGGGGGTGGGGGKKVV